MGFSRKFLIGTLVAAAICSIVLTVSESERIFSESKEVPSEMPSQPEELPPLASHEEAISIAHEFLSEVLGDEFFNSHFALVVISLKWSFRSSGLEPSYKITLSCDFSSHRICWVVMKDDSETLDVGDLMGLLIDAENGAVLETWTKGRMG